MSVARNAGEKLKNETQKLSLRYLPPTIIPVWDILNVIGLCNEGEMPSDRFLINEALWETLTASVSKSKRVDAAIAYFGQDGAELLKFRGGHRLVVDMSPATVKAGATNPSEIEKLIARGVKVFTRKNLHAKVVIADRQLFAGSANVSKHSRNNLEECALVTSDRSAVQRARDFINRLCTEPVRPEYLAECKRLYRPPRFEMTVAPHRGSSSRITHAKLWMVRLQEVSIPESEHDRYDKGEAKARELAADPQAAEIDNFHWPTKPKMADELELGDWIVRIMKWDDGSVTVHPPAQFLYVDRYLRDRKSGKQRWVFHLEVSPREQTMSWASFRKATRAIAGMKDFDRPRTQAMRDTEAADKILGLWTASGRIARR